MASKWRLDTLRYGLSSELVSEGQNGASWLSQTASADAGTGLGEGGRAGKPPDTDVCQDNPAALHTLYIPIIHPHVHARAFSLEIHVSDMCLQ